MKEALLAALSLHGSPVLFGVVAIAAVGLPLPVTLLLIVAGSLAAQGMMDFWWAITAASLGSVLGDQVGYGIGRWGGSALIRKYGRLLGDENRIRAVEAQARRWGGPGIFFTRWLITPLGPWVNLASGTAEYPWLRFLCWDIAGEVLGVVVYMWLGRLFSDRVQELSGMLGDFSWAVVTLLVAAFLFWKLLSITKQSRDPAVTTKVSSER